MLEQYQSIKIWSWSEGSACQAFGPAFCQRHNIPMHVQLSTRVEEGTSSKIEILCKRDENDKDNTFVRGKKHNVYY